MKGSARPPAVTTVWRPSASIARLATPRAIAFADIGALFDASTGRIKDLDTLPPEIACTVESVTRRRWPDGRKMVKVQLRDKARAFEQLAVETGLVPGRRARRARVTTNNRERSH
jgi:hypothetical protein